MSTPIVSSKTSLLTYSFAPSSEEVSLVYAIKSWLLYCVTSLKSEGEICFRVRPDLLPRCINENLIFSIIIELVGLIHHFRNFRS